MVEVADSADVHVGQTIRAWIDAHGLTVTAVALASGRDSSTLSRQLQRAYLTPKTLVPIAQALTELTGRPVTADMLKRGDLPGTTTHLEPVGTGDVIYLRYAGEVPCGAPVELVDDGETIAVLESWLERGMTRANTVVMRAKGTSLTEANVFPGDLVLIRTDVGHRDGDLVLVNTPAGCTLKQVVGLGVFQMLQAVSAEERDHEDALSLRELGVAQIQGVVRKVIGPRDMG